MSSFCATTTSGSGRLRSVITLKSSLCSPSVSEATTATSPGKATGTSGSQRKSRPPPVSRNPGPDSTVRFRSTPGKTENGPSSTTAARESRTSSRPSRSSRHISTVVPRPFFQGCRA